MRVGDWRHDVTPCVDGSRVGGHGAKQVDVLAHATKLVFAASRALTTTLQHRENAGEMTTSNIATAVIGLSMTVLVWLYRINQAMNAVPLEAAQAAPRRWTINEIQETYERMKKNPSDFGRHLPPSLDRRYVVFGGAGKPHNDTSNPFFQLSAFVNNRCFRHGRRRYRLTTPPTRPVPGEHSDRRLPARQPTGCKGKGKGRQLRQGRHDVPVVGQGVFFDTMARIGGKETPDRLPYGGHDRSFGAKRAAVRAYPASQCRRNCQRTRGC